MSETPEAPALEIEAEDLLLSDDLNPTDGQAAGVYYPTPDEDQQRDEAQEKSSILAAGDILLTELMEWFDEQIATAESVTGMEIKPGVSLEDQLLGKIWLGTALREKKAELLSRWETFTKVQD